jgi:NADPH-dependent curcumin reductase
MSNQSLINHQWLLDSRPAAEPVPANWRWAAVPVPSAESLREGQVLLRHHYLSLDPYMRMRMNDMKSYAAPQALGEVMVGGTAGQVLASRHPKYAAGDFVINGGGWQEYAVVDATQPGVMRKVEVGQVPLSAYLGAVGMPGVTAWLGLVKIIGRQRCSGWRRGSARESARLPRRGHCRWAGQVRLRHGRTRVRCLHRLQGPCLG